MSRANEYRTHNSSNINESLNNQKITFAGWIDTIRDHGGIIFLDVRDHYGFLQVVVEDDSIISSLKKEQCISAERKLWKVRDKNSKLTPKINTGTVELFCLKNNNTR